MIVAALGLTACDPTGTETASAPQAAQQMAAPVPLPAITGGTVYNPNQPNAAGAALPATGWAPTPTPTTTSPATTGTSSRSTSDSDRSSSGSRRKTSEPEANSGVVCRTLGLVGDSTAILMHEEGSGTAKPGSMGTPLDVLADAGVETLEYDILGGRSFVEGSNNGIEALRGINDRSTPDCYALIMGTNDAANIQVGSSYDVNERAKRVMDDTGSAPVFWFSPVISDGASVNGYTASTADNFTSGLLDYAQTVTRLWVVDTRRAYESVAGKNGLPSSVDGFFEPDGIHYPSGAVTNYRAQLVADQIQDF